MTDLNECVKRHQNDTNNWGMYSSCEGCPYYDESKQYNAEYCRPACYMSSAFPIYWDIDSLEKHNANK